MATTGAMALAAIVVLAVVAVAIYAAGSKHTVTPAVPNPALSRPILQAQVAATRLVQDLTAIGQALSTPLYSTTVGTSGPITNVYGLAIQRGVATASANSCLLQCSAAVSEYSLAVTRCLRQLVGTGCVPGAGAPCGYATDTAALTASSDVGRIQTVASEGWAIGPPIAAVLGAMSVLVSALNALGQMTAAAQNGIATGYEVLPPLGALTDSINAASTNLTTEAFTVSATSASLSARRITAASRFFGQLYTAAMATTGAMVLAAIVVLAVVAIAIYATRKATPGAGAGPVSGAAGVAAGGAAGGACTSSSSCQYPATCVAGVCSDPALPGLLVAAQNAAQALYLAIQTLFAQTVFYNSNATAYVAAATALGVPTSGVAELVSTLATDVGYLTSDLKTCLGALSEDECITGPSISCGYCADISALSIASSPGRIFIVAGVGASVSDTVATALNKAPVVVSDISTLVAALQTNAVDAGISFLTTANTPTLAATTAITFNANGINLGFASTNITNLANAVKTTSGALYSHFVNE